MNGHDSSRTEDSTRGFHKKKGSDFRIKYTMVNYANTQK